MNTPENTPELTFLGWDKPAIELVAEKLLAGLNSPQTAEQYRRAIVVVPTAGSGQRLREFMVERAGKPILMPKIQLAGQLISVDDEHVATEMETLAAWLQVLTTEGADPVAQYAPLIPRRPDTHRERWAVGVAHKLMALRSRILQEEVNLDAIGSLLGKHEAQFQSVWEKLPPEDTSARYSMQARKWVAANEQLRWHKLQSLFDSVDALLAPKIPQEKAQDNYAHNSPWPGQARLLIMACVPEFSPQIQSYLRHLHGLDGGKVEIWVHAPCTEACYFDDFGLPLETAWTNRKIEIPDALIYGNKEQGIVDNEASAIHQVNDAEAMAAEALRLAGGQHFRDVVLAVGDSEFSPGIVNAFATATPAWKLNLPEGRNAMTTDLGKLPGQLADACTARENLPLWSDALGEINNNGTQGLDAFIALLTNTAMQKALAQHADELAGLQEHVEHIRLLLLPGSESALLSMLKDFPAVKNDYKSIAYLKKNQNTAFFTYAQSVSDYISNLCKPGYENMLNSLADKLEQSFKNDELKKLATRIAKQMRDCAKIGKKLPSPLCGMELLRRRVEDEVEGPSFADLADTTGDLLGWRELAYTAGKQVILAAMHDGYIPEPVPEDDFLPESLCNELGIRHEKFRHARDSYLLTALMASRQEIGGRVDFILARQKADGSVLAPSSLLLRCRDEELPQRALTLFAESKAPKILPKAAECPLRRVANCPKFVSPGELESITQIAPDMDNPYTVWRKNKETGTKEQKSFSPSSLSLFLQCPLTFWIKNLFYIDLGDSYKENKGELESNEYGTVIHAVLDQLVNKFPDKKTLYSTYPETMNDTQAAAELLLAEACQIAADEWQQVYNSTSARERQPLAMEVQLQAIERTLSEFVSQHIADLNAGWCNVVREYTLKPTMRLANGDIVTFSMNADRIDRNEDGRWRIIDYKTSSNEKTPHKVHFDALDGGEDSLYCQFMNVQGYEFGTVPFGEKLYRWNDVQLMLYSYGLRQMNAQDLRAELPSESLADVMPDLVYYNLQSKTEKLVVFPLVQDGKVVPISTKAPCHLSTDELLDSAMQTVQSAISMIRAGVCLFSAEALELTHRPVSALNVGKWGNKTPRFGALSLNSDPRTLFGLPMLNK